MQLLIVTSIVAAFITGVAALFAPCCITVLLPSYFGSIFRAKSKVFLMTFIFFLGVLTVYFPLGAGIAALGQVFNRFHNIILAIGSIFLITLGFSLLTGLSFSLPMPVHPALKSHNAGSVYFLGILSGIATTCCAPVLAGVLALAALPGSIFWGSIYTISYVSGMVAPLFLLSLFLDKVNFTTKFRQMFRKPVVYPLGSRKISVPFAEFLSGVIFILMGVMTIALAYMNKLSSHSEFQTRVNIASAQLIRSIRNFLSGGPEPIWFPIAILAAVIIIVGINFFFSKKHEG